jgi:hypothetical protein
MNNQSQEVSEMRWHRNGAPMERDGSLVIMEDTWKLLSTLLRLDMSLPLGSWPGTLDTLCAELGRGGTCDGS